VSGVWLKRQAGERLFGARFAPDGGGEKGVITGKQFNQNPMPPAADVLGNPLVVTDLPTHKMPKESLSDRILRFFAQMRIGAQSSETALRWKVQDMTSTVMASLSPSVTLSPEARAKIKHSGRAATVIVVRHPYHLRHIFDFLPKIPDQLHADRRFLELLLSRCLKKYAEQMTLMKGSAFSFEAEAREYLFHGLKLEKQIKKINSSDEKMNAMQILCNNYFHGKNYYYYALLRRESINPDSKLFMLYCRAVYFLARVEWNGSLMEKPNPRLLPERSSIYFILQRDKGVLALYRTDQTFQKQVKSVVEAFPE
jgi:hypothetical protein